MSWQFSVGSGQLVVATANWQPQTDNYVFCFFFFAAGNNTLFNISL